MNQLSLRLFNASALLVAVSVTGQAFAVERYCKVTAVFDTGFLEESLSVREYADVVISSDEIMLGSSLFSVEEGDSIKEVASVGFEKNIEITEAGGEVRYFLNINNLPTNKSGTLYGQVKGESASKIADLDCK